MSSEYISLDRSDVVDVIISLIKDKQYRRRIEKSMEQIDFFKKHGLEDGYNIESIRLALIQAEDADLKFILSQQGRLNEGVIDKKHLTVLRFKSIIKEAINRTDKKSILENEKNNLMMELGEIGDNRAFSSFLVTDTQLEPEHTDDTGDFSGGRFYAYKIPKTSSFSRDTEYEMYDMLLNMFGRGESRGPGAEYTRISYDIEDHGDEWFVKIEERKGYDI